MEESRTAVAAALIGNGALAVLKGITAAATGSAAMLAETFHSIADTGNQGLLFLGMRLGRSAPDRAHPFGHGKNVYFWAFVVSVMLFTLGGAFSIWEAVLKFRHPGEHESSIWAYAVLGGGFVFEAISLGVAGHALRRAKGGRSLREFWRETRDPTLLTVLLEDSAALASLVIAAGGLFVAQVTGSVLWDAAASALIGVILLAVAVALAIESHSLLIGEAAPEDVERAIRAAVEADGSVVRVRSLHTMHVGPREIIAVLGVEFRDDLAVAQLDRAISRLHDRIEHAIGREIEPRFVSIEAHAAAPARRAA